MFGDYFQHDAHELLRCVLSHIDDVVTGLRQFSTRALSPPAMTDCQRQSPVSRQAVSHSFSPAAEFSLGALISPDMSSPSSSQLTSTVHSCQPLSPGVNGEPQLAEKGHRQAASRHWHSLPSSPYASLVVDLCMPRKCKSLRVSPRFRHRRSSSTFAVTPDTLCDRLQQKCKSPCLSVVYDQHSPVKCKNFGLSSCFSSSADDLGKNCEPATSDYLQDSFLTHCYEIYLSSIDELLACHSGDCYTEDCELPQSACNTLCGLTDGAASASVVNGQCPLEVSPQSTGYISCNTLHGLTNGAASASVVSGECPPEVSPQSTGYTSLSVKDQLLLSLHAIESGRSCYISLCCGDTSSLSSESASHHCLTSKNTKTSVKNGSVCQHAACVQDMFGGQMLTETKCLNCGFVGKHTELYEDVALFAGHSVHNRTCRTIIVRFIHYHMQLC